MNLGDTARASLSWLDEQLVQMIGRPITHQKSGKTLRAVYEYPERSGAVFGVGEDEIAVQFGYSEVFNEIGIPEIGEIFFDDLGETWRVVFRSRKNSFWLGENRLVLIMTRHAESVVNPTLQTDQPE